MEIKYICISTTNATTGPHSYGQEVDPNIMLVHKHIQYRMTWQSGVIDKINENRKCLWNIYQC